MSKKYIYQVRKLPINKTDYIDVGKVVANCEDNINWDSIYNIKAINPNDRETAFDELLCDGIFIGYDNNGYRYFMINKQTYFNERYNKYLNQLVYIGQLLMKYKSAFYNDINKPFNDNEDNGYTLNDELDYLHHLYEHDSLLVIRKNRLITFDMFLREWVSDKTDDEKWYIGNIFTYENDLCLDNLFDDTYNGGN